MGLINMRFSSRKYHHKISYLSYVSANSILDKFITIKRLCKIKNANIGSFTYFANNVHAINCSIGRYCSIGPFVKIGLGKHPIDRFSTSPIFYSSSNPFKLNLVNVTSYKEFSEIKIGNDVWIGANSIILDGISIGNGAIIAAGAVVTKDIPDYAIVGGVPAKLLKYRFNETQRIQLGQTKWWEKDVKELKEFSRCFNDTSTFLKEIAKV